MGVIGQLEMDIFKEWKAEALGAESKDIALVKSAKISTHKCEDGSIMYEETFEIATSRPGWFIGLHGNLEEKYKKRLEEVYVGSKLKRIVHIEFKDLFNYKEI